jgi:hypothetical protein
LSFRTYSVELVACPEFVERVCPLKIRARPNPVRPGICYPTNQLRWSIIFLRGIVKYAL